MDRLLALADDFRVPLLIEADGSRMRPLKAPGEHEPPIPAFATQVVVVAGLTALGQPLTSDWVHRPERFAALSGLEMGQAITSEAVARALSHLSGGLKNIPAGARRVVLLNQADRRSFDPGLPAGANLIPVFSATGCGAAWVRNDQSESLQGKEAGQKGPISRRPGEGRCFRC
jgi:probable selenium-dependent hydroxylase accessory protein YqeC